MGSIRNVDDIYGTQENPIILEGSAVSVSGSATVSTPTGVTKTLVEWFTDTVPTYATLNDIKSSDTLAVGMRVRSLGADQIGDGGGAEYEVVPGGTGINLGFIYEDLPASGLQAKLLSGGVKDSKIVYLPTDYPSYQSAIDDLSKLNHTQGVVIDIVGESGWEPDSGVYVSDGDYGHFHISHEDAVVNLASGYPGTDFVKGQRARMPVLNCLVDAGGLCFHGYYAEYTSLGYVSADCGVINAGGHGLYAHMGAIVAADDTKWTGASQAVLAYAGILAWGATISAERADVSDSLYYGAQAAAGGTLSFRDGVSNNTGRYGIRATNNGSIDARRAQVSGNALYGIYAFRGSRINAMGAVANNNASANVYASSLSFINFSEDTLGQSCDGGGSIAQIYATGGSVVECGGVTLTNGASIAIRTESGGKVVANVANISGYSTIAVETNSGEVRLDSATIDGAGSSSRVIECRGGIVSARAATITNPGATSVRVSEGGTVNLTAGTTVDGNSVSVSDTNMDTLNGFSAAAPSFGIIWA